MAAIDQLIAEVIQREGPYNNIPGDKGGPTCWGITQATLAEWRGRPVSAEEVAALTQAEAAAIYQRKYISQPGFDGIGDPHLEGLVFDSGVNSGVGSAAKWLQTALCSMGLYHGAIDGGFGPLSRAALMGCSDLRELYYRVLATRAIALLRYIGEDNEQAEFSLGWANRLAGFN